MSPRRAPTIQQLPVELLVDTFAAADEVESWGPFGFGRGRGIAKLMLVCRSWRDIALSTPYFWRHIDINSAEPSPRVQLLLERSSGCTIDVRLLYRGLQEDGPTPRSVQPLLPHVSRIRSLDVNLTHEDFPFVLPLFARELPMLETLEIIPVRAGTRAIEWTDLDLSRKAHPKLQSLSIRRVFLPPPGHSWCTLRVLKLYDYPTTSDGPLPLQDFLQVLSNSRASLEELYLWFGCIQHSEICAALSQDVGSHMSYRNMVSLVHLPRLRIFSAQGPFVLIATIQQALSLPDDISQVDIRT
ncbi:uncharacterized protein BXZ73DRAFT_41740, partial [Epithele typhae]|uniref:uncharacterized protein n=1 Tax=Epithele typhae TaxID=378194 RepID=UPI002007706E